MRDILLDGVPPATTLMVKLAGISVVMLGTGILVFRRLTPRFYDHL